MTAIPDTIIELIPDYCRYCGISLKEKPAFKGKSRQIVDITPSNAIYTDCKSFHKICNTVRQNIADYPKCVNAPVSYGENIEALVACFHTRQYSPFARLNKTLNDAFGGLISEGGVHFLLHRFPQKASQIYRRKANL